MEITAQMVKQLRESTGAGMLDCKKALTETNGDIDKAEELLRIKSGAKANKAAGRIAAEGVIGAYVSADGKLGALVEVNSETDFVAKNEEFVAFAKSLAELAASKNPKDVAELSAGGMASILVPFPHAVDDHQTANGRFLADHGAALLIQQRDLTPQKLAEMIRGLDRTKLLDMARKARALGKPDAASIVAQRCMALARAA